MKKSYKKHICTLKNGVVLGSAGVAMMAILSGCENSSQQQNKEQNAQSSEQKQQNKFLVIEQKPDGKYVVVEEMPTSGPSRAMIRQKDANGTVTERIMSEEEMKKLAEQEYKKVQDGTSETLKSESGGGGMGLAGTILAVAAGSLLGNMVGNALMNNKNFAQRSSAANQSAYSRPSSGGSTPNSSSPAKKSFFGGSSSGSSSASSGSSSSSSSYGG